MATTRHVKSLPDLLIEQGVATLAQVQAAQAQATSQGVSFRRIIIQQGLVSEEELTRLLADQFGMATTELENYLIKPEVIQLVPEALARKHGLIPMFQIADSLTVAIADPLNFFAIDELRLKTKCDVKAVLASDTAIRKAIEQYYGSSGTVQEVAKAIEAAQAPRKAEEAATEAPIIQLVNLLVMQAVKEGASDIHLEPGDGLLRTRFRIDGILHEVNGPPAHLYSAVLSRMKVLANLDIAEKRKSQDGRFRLHLEQRQLDLRMSVVPTQFGEKAVLRLLDSASVRLELEELGLPADMKAPAEQLIQAPHGILLVTGPTGSGKTTTLYAALHMINSVDKNIITIEDPIEYQLPGVNQVQVNPKADITFATALRAFLRQDPDVIMVGEIRDRETAEISIQAALTGHLVFSTLHTNDAAGGVTRLTGVGVEPFLIASSVTGLVAQRLVRVICAKCKEPHQPPAAVVDQLRLTKVPQLFRGKGCSSCKQSGYKGRIGIFELLNMTDAIREHISAKAPSHLIRETARREGMRTLREDGVAKALAGLTTVEEVVRVTQLE